jgi:hypothetical protein
LNRHGSFVPSELKRILRPDGLLLTQQVGGTNHMRLNEMLQDHPVHPYAVWNARFATEQLQSAGFKILTVREEFPAVEFLDVGALVYYLKAIPWQVEGFNPTTHIERLATIDQQIRRDGAFFSKEHRFLIETRSL